MVLVLVLLLVLRKHFGLEIIGEEAPSSVISGSEGLHLSDMILAEAKWEDYHKTIGFSKQIGWFRHGEEAFFKAGGILQDYTVARFGSLRKKLASAENHAL